MSMSALMSHVMSVNLIINPAHVYVYVSSDVTCDVSKLNT